MVKRAEEEDLLINDPGESRIERISRILDEVLSGTDPRQRPVIPLGETPKKPGTCTKEAISRALVASLGRISHAAVILGITPSYLRQRIRESEELMELRSEIQEFRIDLAENRLDQRVLENKWPAIEYLLSTQGKSRGYTKRQEISGPEGSKLVFEFSDGSVDKDKDD